MESFDSIHKYLGSDLILLFETGEDLLPVCNNWGSQLGPAIDVGAGSTGFKPSLVLMYLPPLPPFFFRFNPRPLAAELSMVFPSGTSAGISEISGVLHSTLQISQHALRGCTRAGFETDDKGSVTEVAPVATGAPGTLEIAGPEE
ncbi:hypothetical protein CR513_09077, partial [Mucuna pruriens]